MGHLQRRKDVLLNIGFIGLAGDRLHNQSQHTIVGVGIFKRGAHRPIKHQGLQAAHILLQRFIACAKEPLLQLIL